MATRSVRRRGDRRRGVGSRGDRHAQPDVVDGRRLPPPRHRGLPAQGRPHLLRRGRRGGGRRLGSRVDGRAPLGRHRRRLRPHRARRLVVGRSTRRADGHGQCRREGPGVAPAPCQRDARARFDAVRERQRAGQGGRGRPPPRVVPAGGPHRRPVERPGRRDEPSGRGPGRPPVAGPHLGDARSAADRRSPGRVTPTPTRRSRRTWCTVGRRPTRSPTPSTSTSTSAPCRARRRDDVDRHLRDALGELYDHVEVSVLQHSDPTRSEFGEGNPLWDTLPRTRRWPTPAPS